MKLVICAVILLSGSLHSAEQDVCNYPKIVAFLGPKSVGKDTSADFLIQSYGYTKYALADPMKKAVQILFHFSDDQLWGDKKEIVDPFWKVSPREIMQFIGIDVLFDELGNRFPHLNKINGKTFYIRTFELCVQEHHMGLFVISDLRMQEDVTALKKMGAIIIRIVRPDLDSTDAHVSENGVASVTGFDYTLINDGTIKDLEQKIEQIFEELK